MGLQQTLPHQPGNGPTVAPRPHAPLATAPQNPAMAGIPQPPRQLLPELVGRQAGNRGPTQQAALAAGKHWR